MIKLTSKKIKELELYFDAKFTQKEITSVEKTIDFYIGDISSLEKLGICINQPNHIEKIFISSAREAIT